MTSEYSFLIAPRDPDGTWGRPLGLGYVEGKLLWQVATTVAHEVSVPVRCIVSQQHENDLRDLHIFSDFIFVSDALRSLIEGRLRDSEFLPAEFELSLPQEADAVEESPDTGGGQVISGYWLINCWRRLDVIDWEESTMQLARPPAQYEREGSPVRALTWEKLILKQPIPADEHLFGFRGLYGDDNLFVSNALRADILKSGLRAKFRPKMFDRKESFAMLKITRELNRT